MKRANIADLSAAKTGEKIVKPAANASAKTKIPGKVYLDTNTPHPYKDQTPPTYKDQLPPPSPHRRSPPLPYVDLHTHTPEGDNIVVHLAEGASLTKDHLHQLQNYGATINNNTLTIPATRAAEFEKFIIANDLKTLLKF